MPRADYQTIDWYDTPQYYDIIFDADTKPECDFLEAMHAKHGLGAPGSPARRSVYKGNALEPACGSGRLMVALAKRGYRVFGFDLSDSMVKYARHRLQEFKKQATVRVGRMESFKTPRQFDFAFNLVSTFKYLLTEADARDHLQCVAGALKPGGIYILGFHLSEYDDQTTSRERWRGERDGERVKCNIQGWPPDRDTRIERVRSRLVIERDEGQTLFQEASWDFRTYDGPEFLALLKKVPAFEHVATYDFTYRPDKPQVFDGDQLDSIVILRKR